MSSDEAARLVVAVAQDFILLLREADPNWNKAFFRFYSSDLGVGSAVSYINKSEVKILDAVRYDRFLIPMLDKGEALLRETIANGSEGKGVFLLEISCDLNYKIQFEFRDLNRWAITKMNGGTGIPVD